MVSVNIRGSLIQLSTPDSMRGRVSAVSMLFIGASNELGEFESGITAALMGTVPAVVVGGIGTMLVVGFWMKLFPPLLKVNKFSDVTIADLISGRSKIGNPARHKARPRSASRHSAIRAADSWW